jgi:hypothetical protein
MARFFGSVKGKRGEATRLGSRVSGLDMYAASWCGAIHVRLYAVEAADYVTVRMVPWKGRGTEVVLYDGPVGRYAPTQLLQAARNPRGFKLTARAS